MPLVQTANKIFTLQLGQYLMVAKYHKDINNDREAMDKFIATFNTITEGQYLRRCDDSRYFVIEMSEMLVLTAMVDGSGNFGVSVLEQITPTIMAMVYELFDNTIRKLHLQDRVDQLRTEVELINKFSAPTRHLGDVLNLLGNKN